MSVKLYWNKLCPFVQRAWISLLEKAVPVELVYVPLDTDAPQWYKDINPRETVPTLAHNGKIVFESMLIVQYVDETFPQQNALYPGAALTRYKVNYFIDQVGEELIGALYGLLRNGDAENQQNAVKALTFINSLAEAQSPTGPFFLGATFSAAEVALVPFLDRFRTTLAVYRQFDIFATAPRLKAMLAAALQRPSVGQSSQTGDFYLNGYKGYAAQEAAPVRPYKLYSSPTCPFAERARLTAALKGAVTEIVDIDLKATPDWYLQINPAGSVPTLVTPDGDIIKESALIVSYFNDLLEASGAALRPAGASERYDGRFYAENANNVRYAMFGYLHAPTADNLAVLATAFKNLNDTIGARSSVGPFFFGSQISEYDVLAIPFFLRLFAVRKDFPPELDALLAGQTRVAAMLAAARAHPVAGTVLRGEAFYRDAFLPLFKK